MSRLARADKVGDEAQKHVTITISVVALWRRGRIEDSYILSPLPIVRGLIRDALVWVDAVVEEVVEDILSMSRPKELQMPLGRSQIYDIGYSSERQMLLNGNAVKLYRQNLPYELMKCFDWFAYLLLSACGLGWMPQEFML